MAPKNVMTGNDDAAMIRSCGDWPAWPCLPLKRKDNSLEDKNLGVLIADQQHADAVKGKAKLVVYHVYMFDLPEGEEWKTVPRTEYDSIQDLLHDGWIVD